MSNRLLFYLRRFARQRGKVRVQATAEKVLGWASNSCVGIVFLVRGGVDWWWDSGQLFHFETLAGRGLVIGQENWHRPQLKIRMEQGCFVTKLGWSCLVQCVSPQAI